MFLCLCLPPHFLKNEKDQMAYCQTHTRYWPHLDFHSVHTTAIVNPNWIIWRYFQKRLKLFGAIKGDGGGGLGNLNSVHFKSLKFKSDWFPYKILNHVPSSTWALPSPYLKEMSPENRLDLNTASTWAHLRNVKSIWEIVKAQMCFPFFFCRPSLPITQSST